MTATEPIEQNVEEVHCSECNAPMPSIPGWYATVKVNFTCDVCRQKSPRLSALPPLDNVASRAAADSEEDVAMEEAEEDAADDVEVSDDVDVAESDGE